MMSWPSSSTVSEAMMRRRHAGLGVVLPDVPARLVFLVGAFDELGAHRENDLAAVEVHVEVADVAEAFGLAAGDD
jgi:hypothetical protein